MKNYIIKLTFVLLFLVSCSGENPQLRSNDLPQQATEFTLPDISGKLRSMSQWRGKVIVLNFWASWCLPCLREMPDFAALDQLYSDKGLQFVGIAIDQKPAVVKFVNKIGLKYPTLISNNPLTEAIKISQQYGNKHGSLPYTVIVDRKGVIQHRISGELKKDEALKLLLPLL
jgi:peroxiredoxin